MVKWRAWRLAGPGLLRGSEHNAINRAMKPISGSASRAATSCVASRASDLTVRQVQEAQELKIIRPTLDAEAWAIRGCRST